MNGISGGSAPKYFFEARTAARRAATQATQVGIYCIKKDGGLYAKPTCYEYADRVDATIARLEALNPGSRYTTR